jgi:hypothetical protein
MKSFLTLLAILVCSFATPAYAKHHHHHGYRHHAQIQEVTPAFQPLFSMGFEGFPQNTVQPQLLGRLDRSSVMLAHPSGCPRVAFCGCGAATAVFGSPRRDLWQARAWYKFPRAQAASGNAIVRAHHVAILREHVSGSVWMVEDYNSGGHQSRMHARDISGFTVVNPGA